MPTTKQYWLGFPAEHSKITHKLNQLAENSETARLWAGGTHYVMAPHSTLDELLKAIFHHFNMEKASQTSQ